jgi:hypothetical protein
LNTEIVIGTARASPAGTASFPQVVSRLLGAGVEYYYADYVAMQSRFYGENGDTVVAPITYEGLPAVRVTSILNGFPELHRLIRVVTLAEQSRSRTLENPTCKRRSRRSLAINAAGFTNSEVHMDVCRKY